MTGYFKLLPILLVVQLAALPAFAVARGFYADDSRPTGMNNTTFPDVGMPHVLWELQGIPVEVFSLLSIICIPYSNIVSMKVGSYHYFKGSIHIVPQI